MEIALSHNVSGMPMYDNPLRPVVSSSSSRKSIQLSDIDDSNKFFLASILQSGVIKR